MDSMQELLTETILCALLYQQFGDIKEPPNAIIQYAIHKYQNEAKFRLIVDNAVHTILNNLHRIGENEWHVLSEKELKTKQLEDQKRIYYTTEKSYDTLRTNRNE